MLNGSPILIVAGLTVETHFFLTTASRFFIHIFSVVGVYLRNGLV